MYRENRTVPVDKYAYLQNLNAQATGAATHLSLIVRRVFKFIYLRMVITNK